jgi:hypothetical protein
MVSAAVSLVLNHEIVTAHSLIRPAKGGSASLTDEGWVLTR